MIRRLLTSLAAVALIGACFASEADAARYRTRIGKGFHRPTVKRTVYPRYRQIDGKSMWDLGKQNGRWPKL
jgi:hypothetical protein